MVLKIAYKVHQETTSSGLKDYPSESIIIDEINELDYVDAGYFVDFIFAFEALKESMASAYESWCSQYRPPAKVIKINLLTTKKENLTEPPIELDFVSGLEVKLHRKSTLLKGEIKTEEFFRNFNGTTYSDLIVKEETNIIRDAMGFPICKDVVLKWALEDDTFHPIQKTWRKYYDNLEKIQEGKTRRGNLVNALQVPIMGLIAIAMTGTPVPTSAVILEGRRFLADYKIEFDIYIQDSNKEIIQCFSNTENARYITSNNYSWVDSVTPYGLTIRQYLISSLTI